MSSSEYETDEEQEKQYTEKQQNEMLEIVNERIKMAKGFADFALRQLLNNEFNKNYDVHHETNSIVIKDDKLLNVVYDISLIYCHCTHKLKFPSDDNVKKIIYNSISTLIDSLYLAYSSYNEFKDNKLIFEPQTSTFMFNYNSEHRIGFMIKTIPKRKYNNKYLYNTKLEKI